MAVGISNAIPVLANDHPVTCLLVEDAHRRLIHAGTKDTLCQLLHEYFILQGRKATARVVRNCIPCRREKAVPANQPPGPLPGERCTRGEPFETVGVDFAGPLLFRGVGGARINFKRYVCLFTYPRTCGIHLELVENLTTLEFLSALSRRVSRRGAVSYIFSDNAQTCKKANKILVAACQRLADNPKV